MILKKNAVPEQWNLEAADFINKCIRRNPNSRLGLNGIAELKAHVWLKDQKWKEITNRIITPPWKPPKKISYPKKMLKPTADTAKNQTFLQAQQDMQLLHSTDF